MNIILFEPHEAQSRQITICDRRSNHIVKVLRSSPGDRIRIGIINGPTGVGTINKIVGPHVTLELHLASDKPDQPQTDLILAMPRPIMLKRVLSQAATLGVRRIFLVNASKVEKSFFSASLLQDESLRTYLIQGLEQAVDTLLPQVSIHQRFRPFIEDDFPQQVTFPHRLLAHPKAQHTLWEQAKPPVQEELILAIGPEGGWTDYEIGKFEEGGFSTFSLGPRILRVDTAVPAILSQINLLRSITDSRVNSCP